MCVCVCVSMDPETAAPIDLKTADEEDPGQD